MSKISIEGNSLGTGTLTIAAPNTNTNRTLTLPDASGTMVVTGGAQTIEFAAGTAGAPSITFTGDTNTGIFSPTGDTIAFSEGGAEAMRIDSSGNVGIGTGANTGYAKFSIVSASASSYPTYSNPSAGGFEGGFVAATINSNDAFTTMVDIGGVTANTDAQNGGSAIRFLTQPRVSTFALIERARINSDGYFKASNNGTYISAGGNYHEFTQTQNLETFIARNTNASLTNPVIEANATRNTTNNTFFPIGYFNSGASVYRFRVADSGNVTNTNNSYGAISDAKLKQDIVDAARQWDDIKSLRVRKFRYKSDPDGFMQMGLIAQEAELVSPGLIDEHPDYEEVEVTDEEGNVTTKRQSTGTTTKAIKYSVLYMKAVKALQEAMERIETLEASNTALEARIAALETGA